MGLKLNTASSGSVTIEPTNTASNYTLTVPAITDTVTTTTTKIVSGTAVASTSGTSIDFTGIPSWVKRITVMLSGVSLSGSAGILVQSGSGSVETTGYTSTAVQTSDAVAIIGSNSTSGYRITTSQGAANFVYGSITLTNLSSNIWVESGVLSNGSLTTFHSGGTKSFSGVIDRVRITTTNGTDTFDAGSINIMYE